MSVMALRDPKDLPSHGWYEAAAEADGEEWVDLAAVFGTSRIPKASAKVIAEAMAAAVAADDVSPDAPWLLVEYLAGEYLGGSG